MKSLVITGATGGLGQFAVERLQREYRCLPLGRSEDPQKIAVDSIDGLLLIAGAFAMGAAPEDFDKMLDANLMTAVRTVEALRSRIADDGRIIAISSAASLTKPDGMAAYSASKAALNAYIETLAKELQPRGITVNALLPSALDTPAMRQSMPRNRLVPLERVTETIAFLLRPEAAAVTGQLIALTR